MNIEGSTVINQPINVVFAFGVDIANFPRWIPAQGVRQISQGPAGVGTTFEHVPQFLGQRFESTAEVTEYEPNSTFAFKTSSGPVPFERKKLMEEQMSSLKKLLVAKVEGGPDL